MIERDKKCPAIGGPAEKRYLVVMTTTVGLLFVWVHFRQFRGFSSIRRADPLPGGSAYTKGVCVLVTYCVFISTVV
jgi:hypothetical protein